MRTQNVIVLPYTPQWKSDFENIKQEILIALNANGSLLDMFMKVT
jgi:GrpB-like predicted nucleotidyltransferase (UPF0157 family)